MKPKLIIFDLDDCLIDTWGSVFPTAYYEAIKAMASQGLKIEDLETDVKRLKEINENSENTGEALLSFLKEKGADIELATVGAQAVYSFDYGYEIKPLPGVLEMLRGLKADLAIVTRGREHEQLEKMEKAGIDKDQFKKILCVKDYSKGIYYAQLMRDLHHAPEETLVVGDRYLTDLVPAKELGCRTVWVPWGRGGRLNEPEQDEVDYIMKDLGGILDIT